MSSAFASLNKRLQTHFDVVGKPGFDALCDVFLVDRSEVLVREEREIRLQRILACGEPANLLVLPDDLSFARQGEGGVRRGGKTVRTCSELMNEHFGGCVARGLSMNASGCLVWCEAEPFELADIMLLDNDPAVLLDLREQAVLVAHALHEHARPLVDEALGQLFMERIREPVFDIPGLRLPMIRVFQPFAAVRDKRPGPDMSYAVRERVDIAVGPVGLLHLACEPILGDQPFLAHDKLVERRHDFGVGVGRNFPVVRNLADLPKPFDPGRPGREGCDTSIGARQLKRFKIVGGSCPDEARMIGDLAQAVLEAVEAVKIKLCAAPLENFDGLEIMVLELIDEALVEGFDIGCNAECPVVEMAPGAARDLGKFGGRQIAVNAAVELAGAGERDVVHIEIEAHADRVGRNKEIHLA